GQVPTLRDLNRIHLADQIRDADVGCGQLLRVAILGSDPGNGRLVAMLLDQPHREGRYGLEGVVVQLGARDGRDPWIEECNQRTGDAALGLPTLAEQDHVLARQDSVLDLGQDRLVVAKDPRQQRLAAADLVEQVGPHLLLDRARPPPRAAQLTEGRGGGMGHAEAPSDGLRSGRWVGSGYSAMAAATSGGSQTPCSASRAR